MELLPRRVNKLLRESNINPLLPTIDTFHTSLMHFAGKLENFNLGNSAATAFNLPTILNQQKCIVDNRNALLLSVDTFYIDSLHHPELNNTSYGSAGTTRGHNKLLFTFHENEQN